MSSDDWYRNYDWNSEIEVEFYKKLKRARSQREQYIVIQASYLSDKYPKITLSLIDRYFDTRKDQYHDVQAHQVRAEAFMVLGDTAKAMKSFRDVLEREDEFPNHQTTVYVDYPYIVATQFIEDEFENAIATLDKYVGRLMFALDRFKWHASKALICDDPQQASLALDAAQIKRSGFTYHPNVGLVGEEHAEVIEVLHEIST